LVDPAIREQKQILGQAGWPLYASKLRDVRMGVYGLLHYAAPLHAVTNLHLVAPSRPQFPYELGHILETYPYLDLLAIYNDVFHLWLGTLNTCTALHLESLLVPREHANRF